MEQIKQLTLDDDIYRHELWLNSDGKKGAQLIYKDRELFNLIMGGKLLDGCIMKECDLTDSNLSDASLKDAEILDCILKGANFSDADLDQADFSDSNASGADFSDSKGRPMVWPDELYSANLVGSTLHPMNKDNKPSFEEVSSFIGILEFDTFEYAPAVPIGRLPEAGKTYVLITEESGSSWDEDPMAVIVEESDFWDMAHSLADVSEEEARMSFWEDAFRNNVNDVFIRYEAASEYNAPDNMKNVGILVTDKSLDLVEEAIDAMDWDDTDVDGGDADALEVMWLQHNEPPGVQVTGSYKAVKEVAEWLEDYVSQNVDVEPRVSYGKQRKAVAQLRKVTKPMKVAAFKKTFPNAFEAVKGQLRAQTIQPEQARDLIEQFGMTWQVSMTEWDSHLQRLSPDPNKVLQFNVDLEALTTNKDLLETLLAMRKLSRESLHPVVNTKALMTVGWVRFSIFKQSTVLLVEEIQSDLPTIRKAISDEAEFRRKLEEQGGKERVELALDLMAPFVKRFYHDALSATFDLAAEQGIDRVEMFTHETKKQFGSPMNVYEKLPKAMGMQKISKDIRSREFIEIDLPKVWATQVILNNPRRSVRKLPKTWNSLVGFR